MAKETVKSQKLLKRSGKFLTIFTLVFMSLHCNRLLYDKSHTSLVLIGASRPLLSCLPSLPVPIIVLIL